MKNKVQTNDHNVNVLVECENGNAQHLSHLDFNVKITKILTNKDLLSQLENIDQVELINLIKNWLKKQPNYAVSNVVNEDKTINYNTIVQFEKI